MTRYLAAVVQPTVQGVVDDASARATMDANARHIAAWIDSICGIVRPVPRLLVFPVLCLTGANRQARGVSHTAVMSDLADAVWAPIREACARNDVYVVSSAHEHLARFPDFHFHTGFVLGPRGLVLRSPKAQAYSAPGVTVLRDIYREYAEAFGEAAILPVVETPIGRLGCLVESELEVPEAARLLRHKGAEVVVHPTLELQPNAIPWRAIKQAVAYTTGAYILSAGAGREVANEPTGPFEVWFGATSTITAPDGTIEAAIERGMGFAVAEINLEQLPAVREQQARRTSPASVLYRHLYAAD